MENDWRSVLLDAVKKVSNSVFADYMLVLSSGNGGLIAVRLVQRAQYDHLFIRQL